MKQNNYVLSLFVIGILFFVFGFVTWLNSVLIPFLKFICQLSDFSAYLVTFAFYISYFITALPSSFILKKIGFVKGMSLGLITMGLCSLLFIPAALQRNYILFLCGLFGQGIGLSLLQTAANPYITVLGPLEKAAQRMSIMGICNKCAGIVSIFVLSSVLFNDMHLIDLSTLNEQAINLELNRMANKLIIPYILMAVLLFILAVMVLKTGLPDIRNTDESEPDKNNNSNRSLWSYIYMWLGVFAMFFYVGAEVIAIDTLPLYGEYIGLTSKVAAGLGSYSLIALILGYISGIFLVPKFISQRHALIICVLLDLIFLAGVLIFSGILSIVFIILLSFAHAMIWPCIWPLSIDKLGKHTATASALLIMGIAGGAILPLIYGGCVDILGGNRHIPYLLLTPSYLFILFYAMKGYKIGKR